MYHPLQYMHAGFPRYLTKKYGIKHCIFDLFNMDTQSVQCAYITVNSSMCHIVIYFFALMSQNISIHISRIHDDRLVNIIS